MGVGIGIRAGQQRSAQGRMEALQRQARSASHASSGDDKKLMQAARDFEAIFVQQVLDMMDKTIDRENSLLSGGNTESYWRGMLNGEIARVMCAGRSGFGLAECIYRQMSGVSSASEGASGTLPGRTGETHPLSTSEETGSSSSIPLADPICPRSGRSRHGRPAGHARPCRHQPHRGR